MSYEQIAIANGITEPVNGSWVQAICESLGIMQPVNGSWTQVLAQYGPFPNGSGSVQTVNTTTLDNFTILSYSAGGGPKGTDVYEFEFTIYFNDFNVDEGTQIFFTNNENGFPTANGDFAPSIMGVNLYENGDQYFYFEVFLTSPGIPEDYVIETQFVNTTTGQLSDVKSFTVTLTPPTP